MLSEDSLYWDCEYIEWTALFGDDGMGESLERLRWPDGWASRRGIMVELLRGKRY